MKQKQARYPIRTVSELTGIHPVTLRAWERRYGLITPERTPKGHRLYSQEDIELIREVLALLDGGMSIGQVKSYLSLAEKTAIEAPKGDDWSPFQRKLLTAIHGFDEEGLENTYNEALSLYPVEIVTDELLKPLLRTLGERWHERQGGIAEEHFFSTFLRNKLGARLHHMSLSQNGPKLVAACLPGEQHEFGLLLFCLTAGDKEGYRFIILGANTPLEEIAAAGRQAGAAGILLSGFALEDARLWRELKQLVRNSPMPVFVGGRLSIDHEAKLSSIGAIPLGTETAPALQQMSGHLHS